MMKRATTFDSVLARRLKASPRRPAGEARNQREFDRVKTRYETRDGKRVRSHWYHGNLAEIAKKLGREEEHFWFLSQFNSSIHGGPSAVLHGPVPAGADLMILAMNIICRGAQLLSTAANMELSSSAAEVLREAPDDLTDLGAPDA